MINKNIPEKEEGSRIFTLFILFFPGLLVALIPSEMNGAISFQFIAIKTLCLFYQFIVLANFVNKHYE